MKPVFSSLLLLALPASIAAKAILGVDLGSLYMKVALVQRNSPLEIVTNLHSKRKTEVMVLFDQGSRFYGADASSLLARKPQLTPSSLGVMLGRDEEHPAVKVRSVSVFDVMWLLDIEWDGVYEICHHVGIGWLFIWLVGDLFHGIFHFGRCNLFSGHVC